MTMMRIETLLHAILFTPMGGGDWGLPVLFESQPGTGKTQIASQIIKRYGGTAEVLSPSERGDGAFGCVPTIVKHGSKSYVAYPPPEFAVELEDSFFGGIVVDEVTTAMPHLQAAMLGLIGSRRLGAHRFGGHVRIFGLCNPVALAANGNDLAPPLANRFGWIPWTPPTGEEHAQYLSTLAFDGAPFEPRDATAETARVSEAWPAALANAAAIAGAFHVRNTGWKNKCPAPDSPTASRAWPSDRTWEYATRAMATARVHGLDELDTRALCEGFVGPAAWAQFTAWLAKADLPDPADVLDGKVEFTHAPETLDRTMVVLAGAVGLLNRHATGEHAKKRADRFWDLVTTIGDETLDVVKGPVDAVNSAGHLSSKASTIMARLNKFRNVSVGT